MQLLLVVFQIQNNESSYIPKQFSSESNLSHSIDVFSSTSSGDSAQTNDPFAVYPPSAQNHIL